MWCTSDTLYSLWPTLGAWQCRSRWHTPRGGFASSRAYRLAVTGVGTGAIGVVGLVLAIAGRERSGLPIIALIVAALCAFGFMRMVGTR